MFYLPDIVVGGDLASRHPAVEAHLVELNVLQDLDGLTVHDVCNCNITILYTTLRISWSITEKLKTIIIIYHNHHQSSTASYPGLPASVMLNTNCRQPIWTREPCLSSALFLFSHPATASAGLCCSQ